MRINVYGVIFLVLCISLLTVNISAKEENEAKTEKNVNPILAVYCSEHSTITVSPKSEGYAVTVLSNKGRGNTEVSFSVIRPLENDDEEDYEYDDEESQSARFILNVDPPSQKLSLPNNAVEYTVTVTGVKGFRRKVILGVEGLPEGAAAIFNPKEGRPQPVFRSNLKIVINHPASPGSYKFTVYAIHGTEVQKATTTLIVEATFTTTTTVMESIRQLGVIVETDRLNYNIGDSVEVFGRVYLRHSSSPSKATVSIQILDQEGITIHVVTLELSVGGYFSEKFMIDSNANPGTYTVFVTASAEGFKDGFSRTVFTVGSSPEPSIVIDSVYTTSVNGEEREVFQQGESVVIWVLVNNSGKNLREGFIWVEVTDPRGIPIMVSAFGGSINYMEQTKVWVQVKLSRNTTLGLYEVNTLVSTGYISKGGKFIASKDTAFIVS
jgi:uncharacterized membrane protein